MALIRKKYQGSSIAKLLFLIMVFSMVYVGTVHAKTAGHITFFDLSSKLIAIDGIYKDLSSDLKVYRGFSDPHQIDVYKIRNGLYVICREVNHKVVEVRLFDSVVDDPNLVPSLAPGIAPGIAPGKSIR